jgi:hypothetical protein
MNSSSTNTSAKTADGYGVGTVTCPNGLVFNDEQICFEVNKGTNLQKAGIKAAGLTGHWSIGPISTLHTSTGSINVMRISSNPHDLYLRPRACR